MFFLQLPLSLIFSSLFLLTATAIPVSSTELAPDTFSKTIEKGLWFIEHFSPQCGHCRHFKPTWDKLVVESQSEIPQVKTGTLNCLVYGDLCDKNGVKGYPSLFMFEDGKKVGEFKGARELDDLKKFMKQHIKEEVVLAPPPVKPPTPAKKTPKVQAKPVVNLQGEVLALTPDTFSSTLAKGPAFVKFFAPWCGHCKKLAPVWKQLARHSQNKVTIAEVNCDDHGALCKAQSIQGYPTLVWFGQGEDEVGRSEYNGGRKLEQLKAFAEKASAAGVEVLEQASDLDAHVSSEAVVYLLVHSAPDDEILPKIREASAPLLGSPQILASSSSDLYKKFSISSSEPWALVAIKDHDTKLPSSIFLGSSSNDANLRKWLLSHRLPTSVELTQDTFQTVMNAPHAPLVLIAAAEGDAMKAKIGARIRDIAKKWRVRTDGSGVGHGREVVFAWMDSKRWAEWLSSMYGITSEEGKVDELEDVKVVIADHSKLIYYKTDHDGNPIKFTSSTSIFAAVDDAATGQSKSHNSESFIERMARSLNSKMQSLEAFITTKPLQAVFFALVFVVCMVYVLSRLVGSDVASTQDDWREMKGKNRRLD